MGPVRPNPIQRTVRTAHLSVLMIVHNFSTQYSTEQFWYLPSYLQTIIIAETSIGSVAAHVRNDSQNGIFTVVRLVLRCPSVYFSANCLTNLQPSVQGQHTGHGRLLPTLHCTVLYKTVNCQHAQTAFAPSHCHCHTEITQSVGIIPPVS